MQMPSKLVHISRRVTIVLRHSGTYGVVLLVQSWEGAFHDM